MSGLLLFQPRPGTHFRKVIAPKPAIAGHLHGESPMRRLLLALLFLLPVTLLLPAESQAGSLTATVTEPPSTYTDGTAFARPVTYILWGGPEGTTPRELARSVELTVRASSLAPGRYCAQVFAVDITTTRSVYSDGFPSTPWCGTVPGTTTTPPPTEPVAKKPNPVRAVAFETAAE